MLVSGMSSASTGLVASHPPSGVDPQGRDSGPARIGRIRTGCGRTHPDSVADWLEELIRSTCDEPPTLVAHSAPAAFAVRFAVQQSDRLRRLVLVDSGGLARHDHRSVCWRRPFEV